MALNPNVDKTGAAADQRLVIADSAILESWDQIQELIKDTSPRYSSVPRDQLSNFAMQIIKIVAKNSKAV